MTTTEHQGRQVILNDKHEISKAGCLVQDGDGRVLVVLSKKTGDAALPKGHAEVGETLEEVAVRETHEETGYHVTLGERLPDFAYNHGTSGRAIRVAFWRGIIISKDGVGDVRSEWLTVDEAVKRMWPNAAEHLRLCLDL